MNERCPRCGSTEVNRKGFRKTKTLGKRPIRRCRGCKRRFTVQAQEPEAPPVTARADYAGNCASLPGSAWAGP